jgi:hypothetical protein
MLEVIEQKYLKQLPHILGALTLFVVTVALALALVWVRASRPDTPPVFDRPVVMVFEDHPCAACVEFRRTIARSYASTPTGEAVGLRYWDISGGPPPKRYGLRNDVWGGPTTVVFDVFGREAARLDGLPKSAEAFEGFIKPHLRRAQRDLEHAANNRH